MDRGRMAQWVAAFVGERARENYGVTSATGYFWVTSSRTPIRKSAPGDRVLLYISGEGFVGEAEVISRARAPYGGARWAGGAPVQGIALRHVRRFASPVLYKFPREGPHPILGFHPFALTGGFTGLSEEGLEDVRLRAASGSGGLSQTVKRPERAPARSIPKVAEVPSGTRADTATTRARAESRPAENKVREKRVAGQHAIGEGRRRIVLWKLAEAGAYAIKWNDAEKHAKGKSQEARRTWLAGGRGEQKVGAELEGLREHGFYIFHDMQLASVGNVDHVALGPHGFFAIETKSHKGRVSASGGNLLRNGEPFEKDFVAQAWNGCYRLKEILDSEVSPILCFTEAFVEGRIFVKGVRALPLRWLNEEILNHRTRHDSRTVAIAVNALGAATGCFPSAVPRPRA